MSAATTVHTCAYPAILQPVPLSLHQDYHEGNGRRYRSVEIRGPGYEWYVQTPLVPDPSARYERPHHWYGTETRTDYQGRKWERRLGVYFVMDDFGMLVEVPQ